MVCKENVVSWFADLPSYKRIDVMCTLLNMCLPFEIRYLGTCIEDRGKRDYNDLRDTDHHANNITDVMELINISDKRTRRKLVLYIALLHGCNYKCANVIYQNLSNLENQELKLIINNGEDEILEELLLLYTMALNHPAFSYDQKSTFGRIFLKLQQFEELNNQQSSKSSGGNCKVIDQPLIDDNKDVNQLQTGHNFEVPLRPVVPPGLAMPPPGLLPEISQYVHLGFPTVNSMGQWSGQMMISNSPLIYGNNEVINYPVSPLVSRQSSPSQSRSPSRSNSPKRSVRWSFDPNLNPNSTLPSSSSSCSLSSSTTPTSTLNTASSSNTSAAISTAPAVNRTCLPPRTVSQTATTSSATLSSPASTTLPTTSNYMKHSDSSKHSSTARNRTSGDNSSMNKDVNTFKNNLQNCSLEEIRRMSDDDLREIGLTNNAVGQLRNIVRNQTTNGLTGDKKELENEVSGHVEESQKLPVEHQQQQQIQQQPQAQQQQHHHHHHHHHHQNVGMRRYASQVGPTSNPAPVQTTPTPQAQAPGPVPPTPNPTQAPIPTTMDPPAGLAMYHHPPTMFAQNPCYACLTVPVGGVQNRYPRCNAQHMYCLTQLQALRLEESRHCSQSSSSDSTGSRSPPETPPAAPWASNSTTIPTITPNSENITSPSLEPPSYPHQSEVRLRNPKKPHMRSKNHTSNGTINSNCSNSNTITTNNSTTITVPSNIPCVSFPGPSQMAFLPPFPLRPQTTIYNSAYHSVYSRSYQPSYQPNGEILYPPYPSNTPPPPPPPPLPVSMSQNYITSTPILTYTPVQKISCYNCGSHNHLANDCKDQTMEELTKRAQYRLDYSIKQPPDCSDE